MAETRPDLLPLRLPEVGRVQAQPQGDWLNPTPAPAPKPSKPEYPKPGTEDPEDWYDASGAKAPTVILVRHAETGLNAERRFRGWSDVPLDRRGIQMAAQTAQQLSGFPISHIVTSDLTRSEQTATIIGQHNFLPVAQDFNLRPWDIGKYSGMKYADAGDALQKAIDNPTKKPEGGEAFQTFLNRWKLGLSSLFQQAAQNPGQAVIGLTQSRNLGATQYFLTGDKSYLLNQADFIPPGGMMILQFRNGRIQTLGQNPASQRPNSKAPQGQGE